MKPAPNEICPCDSGRKHKKCCRPILQGGLASTPEALMRSRYTGYAAGQVDHIIATTHPQSPHHQQDLEVWADEIRAFCRETTFEGLDVQSVRVDGDRGWVRFVARLQQGGRPVPMQEHSEFLRVGDRWLYLRGIDLD